MRPGAMPFILSLLVPVALLAACGGGNDDSADQGSASASVIQASDLPAGAKATEGLPSGVCDPAQVLREHGAGASKSPMFISGQVRVQEAVGVFTSGSSAREAYDELNSTQRLECISNAIELQEGLTAKILSPRSINVGDKAQSVRFDVRSLNTGQRSWVEIASIRSGQLLASLIFLSKVGKSGEPLVRDVIDGAAELLIGKGTEG